MADRWTDRRNYDCIPRLYAVGCAIKMMWFCVNISVACEQWMCRVCVVMVTFMLAALLTLPLGMIAVGKTNTSRRSRTYTTDHRLRRSASPVLTAIGFVNGKGQFSTYHRIDIPQPINNKIVTGDYVGDPYGCVKLGAYLSTGGFWAHGWNITKIIFIYALFWERTYRSDTATDFHAWWLKRRGLPI